MASSEEIQTLILTTLDTQGAIENTDSLKAANGSPIPYLAVVGVLNSLASKEVLYILIAIFDACHAHYKLRIHHFRSAMVSLDNQAPRNEIKS